MSDVIEVEATVEMVDGFPTYVTRDVTDDLGLDSELVAESPNIRQVAKALQGWVDKARVASGRGSMFDRSAFTPPDNPYDQMRTANLALEADDMVSGTHEITESFAFQGIKWEGVDADIADVFNQMSADWDLDSVVRRMWKREFAINQVCVAMSWGIVNYTVRGESEKGNRRRKSFTLHAPVSISILDDTSIVPVALTPVGGELLAWATTRDTIGYFEAVVNRQRYDPVMEEFFIGPYKPSISERSDLARLGVDPDNLLLTDPVSVWRHTSTKADFERFAPVRLKSVFPLLDLKRQLVTADRAALIGAANYILLIKKGSDALPAEQEEIENLREKYNVIAKLPVIISDHRLEVEIITPKLDLTLQAERYDVLDTRILNRLLGTLAPGARGQRNETNITLSKAVAKGMENRRHMLKRALERYIAKRIFDHPLNAEALRGVQMPKIAFTPANISLDVDAALIQAILNLRQRREISRGTTLEQFGLNQETEAMRREFEEEFFDDIFKTVEPFSSPDAAGRPLGGGSQSQNPGRVDNQTEAGNPSTSQ